LAIQVLSRVTATDAYLNVVLDSVLDEFQPSDPRDAGLVTELCYGTTRRQLWLDWAIARFADRKLESVEDKVLAALRIGAYQLFFMRVPKHAAVGDTVDALKAHGLERAVGFVNAILRKLAAAEQLHVDADGVTQISIEQSHPVWLVEKWQRQFGPERALAMMKADNEPPHVVLRTNRFKTTRDALMAEFKEVGVAAFPTSVSSVGIVLESPGRVEDVYGFDEGLWQVQDEAAQLVGLYADIPQGATVLDACAAPGGKALHLAETHSVVAIDVHQNKLPKIIAEAKRLGLDHRVTTQAMDASKLPDTLPQFDAVLVDAPCTGLGTLRRHPELRYRRQPADVGPLAHEQRQILESCQEHVAAGGLLVYVVCTTEPAEGQDQIEMFLRSHPEFTAEPPRVRGLPLMQSFLRTLPGPEGFDGFFAARLRKMY
jgi:16S rRNA (cytosine967-C5)-methyltransferase